MGVYRFWISRIAVLVPIVLKDHRTDFYGILCAFNGLSEVECGAQPLMQTLAQVEELCNDKDFVDFSLHCSVWSGKCNSRYLEYAETERSCAYVGITISN